MAGIMNIKRILLSAVLVDYLAFTGWAAYVAGWSGIVAGVTNPVGLQMTAELVLFFAVGATLVFRHARQHGRHAKAWAAAVACTGIIGVLLYLISIAQPSAVSASGAPRPALA